MNKKLLSTLLVFALIMFVGINVKAYTCETVECTSTTKCEKDSNAPAGTTCADASTCAEGCHHTKYNCACKNSTDRPDCSFSNGSCSCKSVPSDVSISGPSGEISIDTDQALAISVPDGYSLSNCGASTNAASVSTDGSSITLNPSNTDSITCKKSVTITCTITNGCGSTKQSSISFTVHRTDWSDKDSNKQVSSDQKETCRESAEKSSLSLCYKDCKDVQKANNTTRRYCATEQRGCGKQPPNPSPACYEDSRGFLWWDSTGKSEAPNGKKYQTYNETTGKWDVNGSYKRRDDLDEDSCYVQFKCSEKYPQTNKAITTTCNEMHEPTSTPTNDNNGELTGVYYKRCGIYNSSTKSVGKQFYEITCNETMYTSFEGPIFKDPSKPKSFVYPGTAFNFEYRAKSKIECSGSWDEDFYKDAYKYANKHLNNYSSSVSSDTNETNINWASKASSGMEAIKKSYENWNRLNYLSNPSGEIKDVQPSVTGVTKPDSHKFNLELTGNIGSDGKLTPEECGLHSGLGNVNYQAVYTINIKIPELWYNRNESYSDDEHNEYSVSDCGDGCEKIGRFFPVSRIDSYANRSDYYYHVNISGLGMSGIWSNNETCEIDMHKKDLYFRSVNLNDPFIQKLAGGSHDIGLNWKNDKFDFTSVVRPDVWTRTSQYNLVRITENEGRQIKNELSSNVLYYTGLCSRGQGNNSTVCALYYQAKGGQY